MVEDIYFCSDCIQDLAAYGNLIKQIYEEICICYAQDKNIVCKAGKRGRGTPIIWFLERKGYVITSEVNNHYLIIKPLGLRVSGCNSVEYCAFRNKHE
jgi:hypothetical protein